MSATSFARMRWRDYPRPAASPRRYERVYSGCLSLKRQRLRQIREITRKYAVAMQVYKANKQVPQFPRHTNRPGLVRSEQAPPPRRPSRKRLPRT